MNNMLKVTYVFISLLLNILLILDFIYSIGDVDIFCLFFFANNFIVLLANGIMLRGKNISKAFGLLCYIEFVIGMFSNHIYYYCVSSKFMFEIHSGITHGHTWLYSFVYGVIVIMFMVQLIYLIANKHRSTNQTSSIVGITSKLLLTLIAEVLIFLGMNLDTYRHIPLIDNTWYSNYQIIVAFVLLLLMVFTGEEKGKILVLLSIIVIFFSLIVLHYSIYMDGGIHISFKDIGVQVYVGVSGILLLIFAMMPHKRGGLKCCASYTESE